MIPRLLHQVWIGPRPVPLQWTRTWAQVNPEFEYRLWDEAAIDELGLVDHDLYRRYVQAEIYDGASDVARAEILHRYGGVYADADSIALRPLAAAPFMEAGFFAQQEPSDLREGLITNAFMGAVPGHPVLARYIDELSHVRQLRPMWRVSGPGALTDVLEEHGDDDSSVMILPSWTFFTASLAGDRQFGGDAYAQHFWSTTAERWGHEHATPYPTEEAPTSHERMKRLDRDETTRKLAAAGCIAPAEEADELIRAAAGNPDVLDGLVARRIDGEPIAWLTGAVTFCGLRLSVAPGVYVPRNQTEPLARRAAALLPSAGIAVDLCTGAGAIAAVMSSAAPTARVVASELDEQAVRCARLNGVEVYQGSLDDPLPSELEHRVHVMTAVVPYVPTDSLRLLPRDVQAFESRRALDGGTDGMDLLAEVVHRSTRWLSPGGWLLLELGGDQAEPITLLLHGAGFGGVEVLADEDGDARGVLAQLNA